MKYWVIEIFTSIQGEGEVVGYPSNFVRLAGCNLRCVWCDTKYSWLRSDGKEMTVEEIISKLDLRVPYTTITGGEPLLQDLYPLVKALKEKGQKIIVETNGTVMPRKELMELVDVFSVSPKLRNSGYQINYKFHKDWATYYKFVITRLEDVDEVLKFVEDNGINPTKVILQPNGLLKDEEYMKALRQLGDFVVSRGLPFRVLPQLHRILGYR
ncbi:MAG: hypothetical protein ASUL_00385 [Candidatus Aramenus sulfurataquae]|uniref:7-carboxy-7-deazaguanine synthase n=1 Tax=Candidatus Aramenus sulfurataquae TaxID=1326980 RepID=W7KL18_9CREN|nr:MAG: hypothetical protein ASUL_00385 [Candidatus Aramenus sulfurataquae]